MPEDPQAIPNDPAMPTGQIEEEKLPETASDHAKEQWARLKDQLRLEREQRIKYQSMIPQQPKPQEKEPDQLYDPETGLINEKALLSLQREVKDARERAERAEATAQGVVRDTTTRAQQTEEEEAYKSYPQLDPNKKDGFDPILFNQVREKLFSSMMWPDAYGGKQLSLIQAADIVAKGSPDLMRKAQEEGAKQAIEQIGIKEQASTGVTGSPQRRVELEDELPHLRERTRRGDIEATVARMRKIYSPNK